MFSSIVNMFPSELAWDNHGPVIGKGTFDDLFAFLW